MLALLGKTIALVQERFKALVLYSDAANFSAGANLFGDAGQVKNLLTDALPPHPGKITFAPRRAGAGSLGRMRFVATAHVRGGPVAREAKSLVPSCWAPKETKSAAALIALAILAGSVICSK